MLKPRADSRENLVNPGHFILAHREPKSETKAAQATESGQIKAFANRTLQIAEYQGRYRTGGKHLQFYMVTWITHFKTR